MGSLMHRRKKFLSIMLSMVFVFNLFCSTMVFADDDESSGLDMSKYTDDRLNLTEYTDFDIQSMTYDEYLELLDTFQKVYYPDIFGESDDDDDENQTFSPDWSSGTIIGDSWVSERTHEYVSMWAVTIMNNDKGSFGNGLAETLAIALLIGIGSIMPDKIEIGVFFDGHFYDPSTGLNYRGNSNRTAKSNAIKHYNKAIEYARDGDMEKAYEYVGRCLHYVQDACEPHHAANIPNWVNGYGSLHGDFESYITGKEEQYLNSYTSVTSGTYSSALSTSIGTIIQNAATTAKGYIGNVNNTNNRTNWNSTGQTCVRNAAKYSTMVLYKFGKSQYFPFYAS